ncbi:MAG: T9SS type A sorting domain-containing protein [Crocinitomicaceae bacterium]|nr:T9SS type A sorting domain-containing protein [Crocinitomicaceae bacterium]
MKRIITSLFVVAAATTYTFGQNNISADASDAWIGYVNVFDLPADGGAYQFGSAWEVPKLKTTLDVPTNTITLQPNFNTYEENPADAFWVNQTTMEGNKQMECLTFVEPAGFNDTDLTFIGSVSSNDLDSGYVAKFFIKALDPANGYADALSGSKVFDLPASGIFTVSATAAELPAGLVIQYGFSITGQNANPADEASLGSIVIEAADASITEANPFGSVSTYPNPASELLSISSEIEIDSYKVFSTTGQLLLNDSYNGSIDVAALQNGTYFIEVMSGELKETLSFVKK